MTTQNEPPQNHGSAAAFLFSACVFQEPVLLDLPRPHLDDALGPEGQGVVVGDEHHGCPLLVQPLQQFVTIL